MQFTPVNLRTSLIFEMRRPRLHRIFIWVDFTAYPETMILKCRGHYTLFSKSPYQYVLARQCDLAVVNVSLQMSVAEIALIILCSAYTRQSHRFSETKKNDSNTRQHKSIYEIHWKQKGGFIKIDVAALLDEASLEISWEWRTQNNLCCFACVSICT